ncbi:MAG: nickel pincer cofactor biosynthesis protein LarC [Treponema sp.]|jgi:uncharacterized protein (TIGR00299 family) protein|nr:nickel pincer cofactor biosynthesis protein LarC [Treponema sp.]
MKVLHFDCYAGISGDMALGALVDLGVDPERLRSELAKLGVEGWKLDFAEDERGGLRGLHAAVELEGETGHIARDEEYGEGGGHGSGYGRDGGGHHGGDHAHNSWRDIRALIGNSAISAGAKKRALAIFTRIADAEAEVHGVSPDEVTFHEVGALDSIIDVVGTAICLDMLNPDRITAGPLELGGGTVRCAHGILPVPAPAVLVLVRGIPVTTGGFSKEMTTPTGAAIIAASVDDFVTRSAFTEIKTGCGIGTRRMERPNLLRVSLRETPAVFPSARFPADPPFAAGPSPTGDVPGDLISEELILLETNIDDMTGEALAFLMERLFAAGALDVTISPCVMKKSRPGSIVAALCPREKLEPIRDAVFRNSGAIGFREIPVRRISLKREAGKTGGEFGGAGTKKVYYGGKLLRSKIEYEDRAALARARGIGLADAERLIEGGEKREKDEEAEN